MSDGFFLLYILMALASGILLLVLGARGYGLRTRGRVLSVILGAGALGQAGYLLVFFPGGHYRVGVWPFVAPVYAVVRMVRHRRAVRERERAAAGRLWEPAGVPTFGAVVPGQGGPPRPPAPAGAERAGSAGSPPVMPTSQPGAAVGG